VLDLLDGGSSIDVSLLANYVSKFGAAVDPALSVTDCAGYFGDFCAIGSFGSVPEYRATTRLSWTTGPLITSLRWQWIDGMKNSVALSERFFGFPPPNLAIPKIGSEHYLDLSFNYDFQERVSIYGGIYNLLENDPPLLASQQTESNTDPSLYDPIGRRFFLGLTVRI
jgi:outer membrane receptor protein involved in Fe transport